MIYAVDRKTKEHRLYQPGDECAEHLAIIQADDDGWIEWRDEKECPMPSGSQYEVRIGTQHKYARGKHPELLNWPEVQAYRPILDDKPQAPKRDGEGLPPVGTRVEVRRNDNDWREVLVVAHDDGGIIHRHPATTEHRYQWAIGSGIRPIRTDRERWIDQAADVALQSGDALGNVYDALKSGELPQP